MTVPPQVGLPPGQETYMSGLIDCPRCNGTGRGPCSACGGVGYVQDDWHELLSH